MCPEKASAPKHIAQSQPLPEVSRAAVKWKGLQVVQKRWQAKQKETIAPLLLGAAAGLGSGGSPSFSNDAP